MKIALLVIYNHRYDKNIPRIEKLYEGKFSNIFHIMPFYDGNLPNVIPVYESSYYFQSYIAQAYQHLKNMGFTHYFIVADDMILHPDIDENNLFDMTGIPENECFINDIREVYDFYPLRYVFKKYKIKQKGVEIENILPSKAEAMEFFRKNGLNTKPLTTKYMVQIARYMFKARRLRAFMESIKDLLTHNNKIEYPLVWGYSDLLLLTSDIMNQFVRYCGAFAATKLFVEYAIPTALVFSTDKIKTTSQIKLHGISQIYPKKKFNEPSIFREGYEYRPKLMELESFNEKFQHETNKLIENYPENTFFIHPIKLSQWK